MINKTHEKLAKSLADYQVGSENTRKVLIKEFIKDLDYIGTLNVKNNVYDRISKIIKKWEKEQ